MPITTDARQNLEDLLEQNAEMQTVIDNMAQQKKALEIENVNMKKELEQLELFRPLLNIANGGGFDVTIDDPTAMRQVLGLGAKVYGSHAVAGLTSKDEALVKKARLHISTVVQACVLFALKNNTAEVIRGYLGRPNTL